MDLKHMDLEDLKIDPEFEAAIPPLTEDEFDLLKQNILSEGRLLSPLIIWNGTIVDGHNRYRILLEHPEIDYETLDKAEVRMSKRFFTGSLTIIFPLTQRASERDHGDIVVVDTPALKCGCPLSRGRLIRHPGSGPGSGAHPGDIRYAFSRPDQVDIWIKVCLHILWNEQTDYNLCC